MTPTRFGTRFGLLIIGLLPLSHVSVSSVLPPDLWEQSTREKVEPTSHIELFIPGCLSLYSNLKDFIEIQGSDKIFAAIGEVTRMKVVYSLKERPCTIIDFRTLRSLTSNGRDVLRFYSPNATYVVNGEIRSVWRSGYECTAGLRKDDRILAVFHQQKAEDWNLDPKLGDVWGALAIWHLKGAPGDNVQCLYQLGDYPFRRGSASRVAQQRRFVTDGRTLTQGIRALEMAHGSIPNPNHD